MSAPEIDFKQLGDDASIHASEELESAATVLPSLLETMAEPAREVIRENPVLVVGHALIAQIDALAQEIRLSRANPEKPSKRLDGLLARFKKMCGINHAGE